eukprot:tig00020875_g14890.t1
MPPRSSPTGGDPRKPSAEKRYVERKLNDDELPADYLSLLSLLNGMVGLWMRQRIFAWLALFCTLSSLANIRWSTVDPKQLLCSVTFAITGLILNYFGPAAQQFER